MLPLGRTSAATAVLLPGSGSDANFAARAFAPVAARCAHSRAVDPRPPSVVGRYWDALDCAAAQGPLVICGVSLGSVVGVQWALANPAADAVLVLALPPWTGQPDSTAPAAISAAVSAETAEQFGLDEAIARMRAGSPAWLSAELTRSWARHGAFLSAALREAASYPAPTPSELGELRIPTVVVGAAGDPVHPLAVSHEWSAAIRGARLRIVSLVDIGADPASIGRAALAAL